MSRRCSVLVCALAPLVLIVALGPMAAPVGARGDRAAASSEAKRVFQTEHRRAVRRRAAVRRKGARRCGARPRARCRGGSTRLRWAGLRSGVARGSRLWGMPWIPMPRLAEPPPSPPAPDAARETPPPAETLARRLGVTAREFSLSLTRPLVGAGNVRVELRNGGEDPHDLVLDDRSGGRVGAFDELAPGGLDSRAFDLTAGDYTLYCSLPGHRQAGMKATLEVR